MYGCKQMSCATLSLYWRLAGFRGIAYGEHSNSQELFGACCRHPLPPALLLSFEVGNRLQRCNIVFRTGGLAEDFVVFAPYIQGPSSPLLVSFRTTEHGLYGSTSDLYRLELWVENSQLFLQPSQVAPGCNKVLEISETFPALQDCRFEQGHFILTLQSPLLSSTEYTFVAQWPILGCH